MKKRMETVRRMAEEKKKASNAAQLNAKTQAMKEAAETEAYKKHQLESETASDKKRKEREEVQNRAKQAADFAAKQREKRAAEEYRLVTLPFEKAKEDALRKYPELASEVLH